MKKRIIISILVFILVISLMIIFMPQKRKATTFIESVQNIYESAIKEHNNSNEQLYSNIYEKDKTLNISDKSLNYMVKFNDNGEIIYLVVSNGEDRFQMGSLEGDTIVKKEDIKKENIVKDVTIIDMGNTYNNYKIINSGSNSNYVARGFYYEGIGNITIALGQKNSGTYSIEIDNIYVKNGEYTIVVKVNEPQGDYQIQVLSYPFITINLNNAKVRKLIIKDLDGNKFDNLTEKENTSNYDTKSKQEEEIRTIIIEKKDVTQSELDKLDKDSDGRITPKDIEVIKETQENEEKEVTCSKGQYYKDKKCNLCPADTYGEDGKKCVSCPAETCSKEGSKSILDCRKCTKLSDPVEPKLETE